MQGGTLDFTLSATPDKRWGTAPEYAPYSYTEQPTVSIPYIANDLDLFEGEITAELKSTTPEADRNRMRTLRYTASHSS